MLVSYRPLARASSVGVQASRKPLALLARIRGDRSDRAQQNADVAVTTVRGAYGEWAIVGFFVFIMPCCFVQYTIREEINAASNVAGD